MDDFYERLLARTATFDELLSGDFEPLPGQKRDTDLAARRLAAWCRSCASGDWALFNRRLSRDDLSIDQVLMKFATVRRKATAPRPVWLEDAIWINRGLHSPARPGNRTAVLDETQPYAFEHLFTEVVENAAQLLWPDLDPVAANNLTQAARDCLALSLLKQVTDLCAAAIYERFCHFRNSPETPIGDSEPGSPAPKSRYSQFVIKMKDDGFRRLFEDKPVLLRLLALIVRQWIDASRELVLRLHHDLPTIRREIIGSRVDCPIVKIESGLSDPHNNGRSVHLIIFEDGARVVYKPKDLRLEEAWQKLVASLHEAGAPIQLKTASTIVRDGYGWVEFMAHRSCVEPDDFDRFFRRAGAWLALFHCFAATDMHQENLIAVADHPVPIDIEMILQPARAESFPDDPEAQASAAATNMLANSVMAVGLLPSYSRGIDHKVFAVGGLIPDWSSIIALQWNDINSDKMRPFKSKEVGRTNPNLPYIGDRYAAFGDYIDDFLAGFEEYARFLLRLAHQGKENDLLKGFEGLPVRNVIRPTRFYYMLLQRLKDHRSMDDGIVWSVQADFIARLADWESDFDAHWLFQRAERCALLSLNVPYFVCSDVETSIGNINRWLTPAPAKTGLTRVRDRIRAFDEHEITWQVEVIGENTKATANSFLAKPNALQLEDDLRASTTLSSTKGMLIAEADRVAAELSRHAIRRGSSAAWIGLDWLGDAEVFQLVCLGPALYNGASGIALFLAAHASVRESGSSRELALAGVSHVRKNLRGRNAARIARSLGIGGAAGLGSIVYTLTEMSKRLLEPDLLADAMVGSELFTDELIAADKQLDVIGGSAGAILALLRLYRDTQSDYVLKIAQKCGEHLIAEAQHATQGGRNWVGQALGPQRLTGISHGAAGFAYALASLFAATGREEFAQAASDCMSFEDSTYDPQRHNWPDFRSRGEPSWPCQWCHGAVGIGLARLGSYKRGGIDADRLLVDVRRAVDGAKQLSPTPVDTLCCGTLGGVELFCEAANVLRCDDLNQLALQRLQAVIEMARHAGDYRWDGGSERFNLGLFRGIAGLGYTLLRQLDRSLPNVLIWD